jgi:drug/metabolite transporter (DMT)-like permease
MKFTEGPAMKWLLMILLSLIWGSSFILMKRGLVDFSSDQVAGIRMAVSFLCLFPFVMFHASKIKKYQWKYIFATGLLGNCIPAFLFTAAQTHVPSFIAGMLNSLTPVFTIAIGYFVFKTEVTFNKIAGVVLGLLGAIGLIMASSGGAIGTVSWYAILIVIACAGYGMSVNIIRNKLHDVASLHISGFALLLVGPPSAIYVLTTDFTHRLSSNPHALVSLGYIFVLAIFGTAISIVIFNQLIKTSGALFASSVTYLIPIVAMLWGLADGEQIGWFHLVAMGAILGGVYLINLKKKPEVS